MSTLFIGFGLATIGHFCWSLGTIDCQVYYRYIRYAVYLKCLSWMTLLSSSNRTFNELKKKCVAFALTSNGILFQEDLPNVLLLMGHCFRRTSECFSNLFDARYPPFSKPFLYQPFCVERFWQLSLSSSILTTWHVQLSPVNLRILGPPKIAKSFWFSSYSLLWLGHRLIVQFFFQSTSIYFPGRYLVVMFSIRVRP